MFKFNISTNTLDNGLKVLLLKNSNHPLVAFDILYNVGSANDPQGKSGLAHLFEHMMFEGSQNVKKGEHFAVIEKTGGSCNAGTGYDDTSYYEKVPKQYLDTVLYLESDRMANFIPALNSETLENQIGVVKNERSQRYDNQPYGLSEEKSLQILYKEGHPYSKPIIGTLDEIGKYSQQDVEEFFKLYYAPNNATIALVGDFNEKTIMKHIDKYFGGIQSNPKIEEAKVGLEQRYAVENQKKSKQFLEYHDEVNLELIRLIWHTDKLSLRDSILLSLLSSVLAGSKSSVFTKTLKNDMRIVQDISCSISGRKYDNIFKITAKPKPGKNIEEIKSEILLQLNKFLSEGIDEKFLRGIKNYYMAFFIRGLEGSINLAKHINSYEANFGKANLFNEEYEGLDNASADEIMGWAKTILDDSYCELRVLGRKK